MKLSSALFVLCTPAILLSVSALAAASPGHSPVDQGSIEAAAPASPVTRKAKVLTVVDVRNYTYLEVVMDPSESKKAVWLAGPTTAVKVGETVRFDEGMPIKDFRSDSLNRTFADILFVSYIEVATER